MAARLTVIIHASKYIALRTKRLVLKTQYFHKWGIGDVKQDL